MSLREADQLEARLRDEPADLGARRRLVDLLWDARELARATPHLRVLTLADPGAVKPWRRLGKAMAAAGVTPAEETASLDGSGELHEEVAVWRRVLELDPADQEAKTRLAELFWEMNRKLDARPYLAETVGGAAKPAKMWKRLAACHEEARDFPAALDAWRQVLVHDPADPRAEARARQLASDSHAPATQPDEPDDGSDDF